MSLHAKDYARKAIQEHKDKKVPHHLRKLWDTWDEIASWRKRPEIREYIATGNPAALKSR